MKLQKTNRINVSVFLMVVAFLVLAMELYLAYIYLYPNLNVSDDLINTRDIVRVDLKSYEKMIQLLNDREGYQPTPINASRSNPF